MPLKEIGMRKLMIGLLVLMLGIAAGCRTSAEIETTQAAPAPTVTSAG